MHRLFRLLHRWKCKNASQKLALDALQLLPEEKADTWQGLFLWHIEPYLRGVDAPERTFKDYPNHVLYAVDDWGGAARLARKWYWRTVESLRSGDWADAAYHAGILFRYATFPFSPMRTGNDELGMALCAPVEWCISQQYDHLTATRDNVNRPEIPNCEEWLEELLLTAALEAHDFWETVKTSFDFSAVVASPPAIDEELREIFTRLLSRAAATLATILDRAITESGAEPPRFPLGVAAAFAVPSVPLFWLTRSQSAASDWMVISKMHREFKQTGRIEGTLPGSAKAVRDAYAIDVLKQSPGTLAMNVPRSSSEDAVTPNPPLTKTSSLDRTVATSPPRKIKQPEGPISPSSPIQAASSINAEASEILSSNGIDTIEGFLASDPEELALLLGDVATSIDIAAWQDEARLCCDLRGLEPVEAQLLVACGVTGADDLAALEPVELWELVVPVAESPDGRRLLGGDPAPDLDTVTRWIDAASRIRQAA